MANRVVTNVSTEEAATRKAGGMTYGAWLDGAGFNTAESRIVVGDIIIDTSSGGPNWYFNNVQTTFSAARDGFTVWIDMGGNEAINFRFLVPSSNAPWSKTTTNSVTFRPLGSQVEITKPDDGNAAFEINGLGKVIVDGESNYFPGLRSPFTTSNFLTHTFGFYVHAPAKVTPGTMCMAIHSPSFTGFSIKYIGCETVDCFAGMRSQLGGTGGGADWGYEGAITVRRCYRHDAQSGESCYFGYTGGELNGTGAPRFVAILEDNIFVRAGAESTQVQHTLGGSSISRMVNISAATDWIDPFQIWQDSAFQQVWCNGNIIMRDNITEGWGGNALSLFGSANYTDPSPTGAVRWVNSYFGAGGHNVGYRQNSLVEGLTMKWEGLYCNDMDGHILDRPDENTYRDFFWASNRGTDVWKYKDITYTTDKAQFFENYATNTENQQGFVQGGTLPLPDYINPGITVAEFYGQWYPEWFENAGWVTYEVGMIVSWWTTNGFPTKGFYKVIQQHVVSNVNQTPDTLPAKYEKLYWDVNGVRSDNGSYTGTPDPDTGGHYPPDNYLLQDTDPYFRLGMGIGMQANDPRYSMYKWYIADDTNGTNKILIYGAKKITFDIDDDRYTWVKRQTGRYIIGSTTPVDSLGTIGTETYATGIIIGDGFSYLVIPDAPIFTDFQTINPTDTYIQPADLGGYTDLVLGAGNHTPSNWYKDLVGTEGTPIRIKGVGGVDDVEATHIGSVGLAAASNQFEGCEWIELYDLYGTYGQGFKFDMSSEHILFQNIKQDGFKHVVGYCGFLSKTDNSYPSVQEYSIIGSYSQFLNTDGEGIYIGETNGANAFHHFTEVNLQHIRLSECGRESIQVAHAMILNISNLTGLNSGQTNEEGQNRAFQSFNCHGTVANSFFTTIGTATSVYCAFIKGDGYTIKNSLFKGREHFAIYTKDGGGGWWSKSLVKGNDPFTVDSCIIDFDRTQDGTAAFHVMLDYCHVILKNCIINSDVILTLWSEGRSDSSTYSVIDGGGNQFLPSSHIAFNPTFDSEDRVTTAYHHNRGMGWLTPTVGKYPSYASVGLSGTEQSGQVLTATPNTPNAGGGSSVDGTLYQWYSADNNSGLNEIYIVTNGQSSTFTLTASEVGKYVRCLAQAVNDLDLAGDTVASPYTGAIAS